MPTLWCFPGFLCSQFPLCWRGRGGINHQHPHFFDRKHIMLISLSYSPFIFHMYDAFYYDFYYDFKPCSFSTGLQYYNWIYYMQCILCTWKTFFFFFLFVIPTESFAQLQVCISLIYHWGSAARTNLCPSSYHSMPTLFHTAFCVFSCHTRPVIPLHYISALEPCLDLNWITTYYYWYKNHGCAIQWYAKLKKNQT